MKTSKRIAERLVILLLATFGLVNIIALPGGRASGADRGSSRPGPERPAPPERKSRAEVEAAYGELPLGFEANLGQVDSRVKFISRTEGASIFLTSTEAVFALRRPQAKGKSEPRTRARKAARQAADVLRMGFVAANPSAPVEGLDQLPGSNSYFVGRDPHNWRAGVPLFRKARYTGLYPGVDLVYYGNRRQLEYDFHVAPGADPRRIKLNFKGARRIRIDANGDLLLGTKGGCLRMHKPSIYQEDGGAKQAVAGRYALKGNGQVGFEVGAYDTSKPLVIDPMFSYSTFLGGTSEDEGRNIAVDSEGNAYVTGRTFSFNFPTTIDAYDSTFASSNDVFVTKMNAAGSDIMYSTYLGGGQDDQGYGIAVDSSGGAYVTGFTASTDYPTTPGAFQTLFANNFYYDAFVTKLNSTGTALVYSTFLGGNNYDQATSIAVDSSGNAYVAGYTSSTNYPTTPGAFQTLLVNNFYNEAFITKLNSTGTALVYSTFLGGGNSDQATSIAVDSSGNAYVTGNTRSTDFDVTPGAFQTVLGGTTDNYNSLGDAFVTKLNAAGSALVYSTYIGKSSDESGYGIAVGPAGEAYITGVTYSFDFPTTPGTVRVSNGGVARTTSNGSIWGAFNSGMAGQTVQSLAINPSSPSTAYAGTYTQYNTGRGIFRTSNSGASWTAINSGLTDLNIQAIAIDPTNTSLIYLGTYTRGVFRSTDAGDTWRAINTGQNGMQVNVLKLDPATPATVYAGTYGGVSKTTNSGANWVSVNTGLPPNASITSLAVDPVTTQTIYAGLYAGVYKSTNGGGNWNTTSLSGGFVRSLAINPSVPSTLYAGSDNGVSKSTDSGVSWKSVNTGLGNRPVYALVISPADSNTIFAGTDAGAFKSTDGGQTWSIVAPGLAGNTVNALAIDPLNVSNVYAGLSYGSLDAYITKLNSAGTALVYSTFLGGSGNDQGNSIALDGDGSAYVTGYTESLNFPTTPGVFQTFQSTYEYDAFVSKLDASGATLVYSTYLGDYDYDQGFGIAVDASKNAYVVGATRSVNFPVTPGAFQTVKGGANYNYDAFITKVLAVPSISADLRISMTATPDSGVQGASIQYNISVTNDGPERAPSVVVLDELPPSLVFQGCNSCSQSGNTIKINIGAMNPGATVNTNISTRVKCSGAESTVISNTATVSSAAIDPDLSNNSATQTFSAGGFTATLNPPSADFTSSGGSSQVNVNTGASSCAWNSKSNVSWITINYSDNCCNGYVYYNVAANNGAPRAGTISIAGQTFTVNQGGICSVGISPTAASYGALGGIGAVNVTAAANCSWTVYTSIPWITINSGSGGSGNGTVSYSVAANNTNGPRTGTINIGGLTITITQVKPGASGRNTFDFDGDARSDISVWRPLTGTWFIINSGNSSPTSQTWGANGDMLVPGDYDGDGRTDLAVWRPAVGQWFIYNSSDGTNRIVAFGTNGDVPVPADYDGDNRTDLAIYRPSLGTWFITKSSDGSSIQRAWGVNNDVPVPADYDGDGKADIATWRPSNGVWYIINSSNSSVTITGWGVSGDKAVPGDYDGDGRTDIAIWRSSNGVWYIINSSNSSIRITGWGVNNDVPVPADYDGDGKVDIAVWRSSSGVWYVVNSSNGSTTITSWGVSTDVPAPSAFINQ